MKAFKMTSEVAGVGTFVIEHPNPFSKLKGYHKPIFIGWNGCGLGAADTITEAEDFAAKWSKGYAAQRIKMQTLFLTALQQAAKQKSLKWRTAKAKRTEER